MFALTEPTTCTLQHVSGRNEMHGDQEVLAVDLKVSTEQPNTLLGLFHEELLETFYILKGGKKQKVIDIVPVAATELRCPILSPSGLETELIGRNVIVHRAINDIKLSVCKVNKFVITPKEGGTVEIQFRVHCAGVTAETIGMLFGLLHQKVQLSLVPSTPAELEASEAAAKGEGGDGGDLEGMAVAAGNDEPKAGPPPGVKPEDWPFPKEGQVAAP